jgi:hypothetical protein
VRTQIGWSRISSARGLVAGQPLGDRRMQLPILVAYHRGSAKTAVAVRRGSRISIAAVRGAASVTSRQLRVLILQRKVHTVIFEIIFGDLRRAQ